MGRQCPKWDTNILWNLWPEQYEPGHVYSHVTLSLTRVPWCKWHCVLQQSKYKISILTDGYDEQNHFGKRKRKIRILIWIGDHPPFGTFRTENVIFRRNIGFFRPKTGLCSWYGSSPPWIFISGCVWIKWQAVHPFIRPHPRCKMLPIMSNFALVGVFLEQRIF